MDDHNYHTIFVPPGIITGTFQIEGFDEWVELPIPMKYIKSIDQAPINVEGGDGFVKGRMGAVRIEMNNGKVLWTQGDRSWYK